MGKKPVVGLAGLFLAGLALSGCQDSKLCNSCKDKPYSAPPMFGKNSTPANGGVQPAAWNTQPAGSVPVGPPGSNLASPGRAGAVSPSSLPVSSSANPYSSSSSANPYGSSTTAPYGSSTTATNNYGMGDAGAQCPANCTGGSCGYNTNVTPASVNMRSQGDPSFRSTGMPSRPGTMGDDSYRLPSQPLPGVGQGPGSVSSLPNPGLSPLSGPGSGTVNVVPPPSPVPPPGMNPPAPSFSDLGPSLSPTPSSPPAQSRYTPSLPQIHDVPPMPQATQPLGPGRGGDL
jgi:hypothetical protein